MNDKFLRFTVFIIAAVLHLVVILFLVFDTQRAAQTENENARVMKLTDLDELPPPPPPPERQEIPQVEEIAETMIETDTPPVQEIVAAGTIITPQTEPEEEVYLLAHQVSTTPKFDDEKIMAALVYPSIALRSGIEGRVFLDLFVDRTGTIQSITIMLEDPKDRGFGEAAVRAFTGIKGIPATANGEPVSCRYRYPVTFRIR